MSAKNRLLLFFLIAPLVLLLGQFLIFQYSVTRDFQSYILDQSLGSSQVYSQQLEKSWKTLEGIASQVLSDSTDARLKKNDLMAKLKAVGFEIQTKVELAPKRLELIKQFLKTHKSIPFIIDNTLYFIFKDLENNDSLYFFEDSRTAEEASYFSSFDFAIYSKFGFLTYNAKFEKNEAQIFEFLNLSPVPSAFQKSTTMGELTFGTHRIAGSELVMVSFIPRQNVSYFNQLIFIKSGLITLALALFALGLAFYLVQSFLTPMDHIVKAMDQVGNENYDFVIDYHSSDEFGRLIKRFNEMIASTRSYIWKQRELVRIKLELDTANIVQRLINRAEDFTYHQVISISGFMLNASECGGDYWSHFENEGRVFVVVGDATGHGTPAALVTSATGAGINALRLRRIDSVNQFLSDLNKILYNTTKGEIYITFCCVMIDLQNKKVEIGLASHSPVFCFEDMDEKTTWKDMKSVGDVSSPLGRSLDTNFSLTTLDINKNYKLMIYTDGFFEVLDEKDRKLNDRFLGREYFNALREVSHPTDVSKYIKSQINVLQKGEAPSDDITFVSISIG